MLASREQIAEQLRRHGLRATGARVSVYAAVESLDGHPDVQTVLARVHEDGETISTQAVYDCLASLTGAGLLRRIEPAGSPARYETRVGDNHHHIVCRTCGATEDIDCAFGAAPCLEPAAGTGGFAVDEAEVTFWGLCPACQRRAASEDLAEAAK
ncbi:MAG TPA: Fur family transcriptional regulator [Solirubrobacterales bacterium]|nr:Fur family transcriptional regulator [Solirubrobacterales bacterium]